MALKRIKSLPTPSGVAAGKTATFDVPVGPRYHTIWLDTGDTGKSVVTDIIGDIRLKINGKVQRTMSAEELDALNTLMGEEFARKETDDGTPGDDHIVSTRLPIFLSEPWRKQPAVADGLAWGTGNVSTFQIEVDIKAAAAGVTLSGYVEADYSTNKDAQGNQVQPPIGVIAKWFRQQIAINGTLQEIQSFPRRDYYQQISFFDEDIDSIVVQTDSIIQRDLTKERNDGILVSREMDPVDERFDVVFDYDDLITSGLPMAIDGRPVQDFQVQLSLGDGTPRNISTITQRLGPPE